MLRSLKHLYGKTLAAIDGEVGRVADFYFDDQRWVVRYAVADTGSWLSGRTVLIAPHAFGSFCQEGDSLRVILTRKQIEECPAAETHKPVSRQYEEDYFRHYGWPTYWEGNGIWGAGAFPVIPPPNFAAAAEEGREETPVNYDALHLRSTRDVQGYHIQTSEGEIGHVSDFLIDDESWTIRRLVVETGHWYAGKKIALSPTEVERVSYEESKVFVSATKESLSAAPEYHRPETAEA